MVMNDSAQEVLEKSVDHTLRGNLDTVMKMTTLPIEKRERIVYGLRRQAEEQKRQGASAAEIDDAVIGSANRSTYTVYHQTDGSSRQILVSQLAQHLSEIDPETRQPVFDLDPPNLPKPEAQLYACFLHPQHPYMQSYQLAAMGLPQCSKVNIPTPFNRIQHMQAKHPDSWRALQQIVPGIEDITGAVPAQPPPIGEAHVTPGMNAQDMEAEVERRSEERAQQKFQALVEEATHPQTEQSGEEEQTAQTEERTAPELTGDGTCSVCGFDCATDKDGNRRTVQSHIKSAFAAHARAKHTAAE